MTGSTISFKISNAEKELVLKYPQAHGLSLDELYRTAVLDKIEDEADLHALEIAIEIQEGTNEVGISQTMMENLLRDC